MLAGLAPLHRERLTARGGSAEADADVFLDTSSYGTRAVDAVARELGVERLVYGSDRPVVGATDVALGDAVRTSLRSRNPQALFLAIDLNTEVRG
jgi:transcriptional regulator GlxA family with amidase domain